MTEDFTLAVNEVLKFEGGYVNHSSDPGGETNYGISKRAYPDLDIKNLTKADAIAIYYRDYWIPSGCDALPMALATCVFDTAVNMGQGVARRMLKECADTQGVGDWRKYLQLRKDRYAFLIARNPKLKAFQKGWLNRVNHLTKFVEERLQSQPLS